MHQRIVWDEAQTDSVGGFGSYDMQHFFKSIECRRVVKIDEIVVDKMELPEFCPITASLPGPSC